MNSISPKRSVIIPFLASLVLLAGALGAIFSIIVAIMLAGGGYGTAQTGLANVCAIFGGPPLCIATGVGLLRRKRWAWLALIALLALTTVIQTRAALTPPREPIVTLSPGGVPTTTYHTESAAALPIAVVSLAILALLFSPKVRAEFPRATPAHPTSSPPSQPRPGDTLDPVKLALLVAKPMTPAEFRALLAALAILLGITALMTGLVLRGLQRDATYWPAKRASQQRTILRAQEPVMFWTSLGVYSAIGLGTLTLAVCCIRWSRPARKP
jgi:hypothetical protein